jgi:hypothetical protein
MLSTACKEKTGSERIKIDFLKVGNSNNHV